MTQPAPGGAGIDWKSIHERLARAHASLAGGARSDTAARLKARARELAREESGRQAAAGGTRIVEFMVSGVQYAVHAGDVAEVFALKHLISLPRKLERCMGIVARRGGFVPLMDIRVLLGVRSMGLSQLTHVVMLSREGTHLGLLADEILGLRAIGAAAVEPAPDSTPAGKSGLVAGLVEGRGMLIDAGRIMVAAAGSQPPRYSSGINGFLE